MLTWHKRPDSLVKGLIVLVHASLFLVRQVRQIWEWKGIRLTHCPDGVEINFHV